ncbi:hypothetical protein L202_07699 [Cryptococcus amylolentus CBS 6039]|uniref:Uncharacterized protein n=1 Tax=Cryptococcus amylolentus CBS 6039 TaxID=1295533 RepID=A0A1E3H9Z0_9TREE|nr:hypothetical protein L202_07699 [Cryptococcus amylolentus CBS 6039]ODN73133.1 hypothetical protein L202_07699 [Cryptococcus amylolentus CBS 6039]
MDAADYTQRLERAVKSAKGIEELEAPVPPDTVSIVFTTEIIQPTRLMRVPVSDEEDDGAESPEGNWKVVPPQARFLSGILDGCPAWVQRDEAALDAYDRLVGEAIGSMTPADISDVQLGSETTCEDFVRDTCQQEHSLFRHAAFDVANRLSTTQQAGTNEAMLGNTEAGDNEEDGRPVDGQLLVDAVLLEPTMYSVYFDRPIVDAANYARTQEYKESIERGLATMRGDERGPEDRDDGIDDAGGESENEGVWGTYRQHDDTSMIE